MQACPHCGKHNSDENRFCAYCGYRLNNRCPDCGFDNLPDQAFCGSCNLQLLEDTALTKNQLNWAPEPASPELPPETVAPPQAPDVPAPNLTSGQPVQTLERPPEQLRHRRLRRPRRRLLARRQVLLARLGRQRGGLAVAQRLFARGVRAVALRCVVELGRLGRAAARAVLFFFERTLRRTATRRRFDLMCRLLHRFFFQLLRYLRVDFLRAVGSGRYSSAVSGKDVAINRRVSR